MHAAVDEIAKSAHARTLLSVERALWTWIVYARFIGEKWCEVWPGVLRSDNASLERAQRRALVALLGRAAPPGVVPKYALLLAVSILLLCCFNRARSEPRDDGSGLYSISEPKV